MGMQKRSEGTIDGKQVSGMKLKKEKKRKELFNLSFCFLLLIVLRFGLLLYIVVINTGSLYLAGPKEKILGDEEILTYTK